MIRVAIPAEGIVPGVYVSLTEIEIPHHWPYCSGHPYYLHRYHNYWHWGRAIDAMSHRTVQPKQKMME